MSGALGEILDAYFALERVLDEYLTAQGMPPRWHVDPLSDERGMRWFLDRETIHYFPNDERTPLQVFEAERYNADTLIGPVVRTAGLVILVADTHCDGNVLRMVFDAALEVTDPAVLEQLADY